MQADVIAPAAAGAEAAEEKAKSATASIIEEGKARADALRRIAETWKQAGPQAREVLLAQKLEAVITALTNVIPETKVQKVTMIDGSTNSGASKLLALNEQAKQVFGVDLVEKVKAIGEPKPTEPKMTPSAKAEQSERE
jgi:flotillin